MTRSDEPFFSPKPLALQVAEAMMAQVARQELGDPLPGEMALAEKFGVSRPVIRVALKHLQQKGIVAIAHGRRTRLVARSGEPQEESRRVLVVGPGGSRHAFRSQNGVLAGVGRELQQRGWHWVEHFDGRLLSRNADTLLRKLYEASGRAVLLLVGSTPAMQQWVEEQGIPALVLGSLAEGRALASVDVHYRALGRHAAGRFAAAGMEEVTLFGRSPMRIGDHKTLEGLRDFAKERAPDLLHVEMVSPVMEIYLRQLRRQLRQGGGRRQGWLFLHPADALTAQTFLLHEGCKIPGEVGLICRDAFPMVEALYPSLAHYEANPGQLIRKSVAKLEKLSESPGRHFRPVQVIPRFVTGGTLVEKKNA